MSTLSELKEQLRRLVSGEPVRTKYGEFNFASEVPRDGYERPVMFYPNAQNLAGYARVQLMKDIDVLEAFKSETTPEPEIQERKPAKEKTDVDYLIEHAKLAGRQINQRRIRAASRPLKRRELAKMILDEAKKKNSQLADWPLWKIERNLTGVCPRGKTPKTN
jgi:hypothetical protein